MERPDILLSLLSDKDKPIIGTTRIQKLVFLVEKETNVKIEDDFEFKSYLFGPASNKVYDDLNFLENLGYIEKPGNSTSVQNLQIDEIENYSSDLFLSKKNNFEQLIEDESYDNIAYQEAEVELDKTIKIPIDKDDQISYRITEKGLDHLRNKKMLESEEGKEIQQIAKKYSSRPLINILKYVYSKYPEFTTQSVIKDKIL